MTEPEYDYHALADRYARELAEIRGSMHEVPDYQGIVDASPLATLVSELVRDHGELEARIDAVMHYLSQFDGTTPLIPFKTDPLTVTREVQRLLQGGTRVPDTPEGITDA